MHIKYNAVLKSRHQTESKCNIRVFPLIFSKQGPVGFLGFENGWSVLPTGPLPDPTALLRSQDIPQWPPLAGGPRAGPSHRLPRPLDTLLALGFPFPGLTTSGSRVGSPPGSLFLQELSSYPSVGFRSRLPVQPLPLRAQTSPLLPGSHSPHCMASCLEQRSEQLPEEQKYCF